MNCQMIRVISSPSSSTTVPSTLILLTFRIPLCSSDRVRPEVRFGSQLGDVRLLGAHSLGRLAEPGDLAVGQVALHHPADALAADLGLHAQVHAGDAVL